MELTTKQKVIAGISGVVLAGLSATAMEVFKSAGAGIGETYVKPAIKQTKEESPSTQALTSSAPNTPIVDMPNNLVSHFEDDYQACDVQTKQNPQIDLNNPVQIYEANVRCLLTEKNQGVELDKRAEQDPDLKQILNKIRSPN